MMTHPGVHDQLLGCVGGVFSEYYVVYGANREIVFRVAVGNERMEEYVVWQFEIFVTASPTHHSRRLSNGKEDDPAGKVSGKVNILDFAKRNQG